MSYLIQRGRDQSGKPNDIGFVFHSRLEDLLTRAHDAQIDDLEVVATQHDADDVLANVVDVAFDRSHDDGAGVAGSVIHVVLAFLHGALTFFFHERDQMSDGFLHHASGFDDLRQEHLAGAEQVTHGRHAVHQRTLDDVQRTRIQVLVATSFFRVVHHVLIDTLDQGVAQALCGKG